MSPADCLAQGSAMLAPILEPHGFRLGEPQLGIGSGGDFAFVHWRTPDGRQLETHVRGALGMVRYTWGQSSFTHQELMRRLGIRGQYPGYSKDPLDGFRHLAADLDGPASVVLTMSEDEFAAAAAAIPPPDR